MRRATIVPIDLGGSDIPCMLRPPLRPSPSASLVRAMVSHYRAERAPPGGPLEVAFFHGGMPDDALLSACDGVPVRVSCSPGDLSRDEANRLLGQGVHTIELDVATFQGTALRVLRRGYAGPMVRTQLMSLRKRGVRLGVTLQPGLPETSHHTAIHDIEQLLDEDGVPLVDFVRLYPALAFEGTGLASLVRSERWVPMHLGEAVTTTLAMMERLEELGIPVARVGLQPGADLPGRVVAGPAHPNLRQLVEVRRFYTRMVDALRGIPEGSVVQLSVNPRDLSWARGTANENVRALRARLSLRQIEVRPDEQVHRGRVQLTAVSG